jgi:hypothetical protein
VAAVAAAAARRSFLPAAVASAARGQRFMAGGVKPYTPLQAAIDAVAKGSGRKFVERLLPHPPSWSRFRYLALRLVGLW